MSQLRSIEWIPQSDLCDDVIVWVDVCKLDSSWKNDQPYYIGPGVIGPGNGERYKYDNFGLWLALENAVWMPQVCLEDGYVTFADGRHRFAWLRDHGMKSLPVAVCRECHEEISARFGVKTRISRI